MPSSFKQFSTEASISYSKEASDALKKDYWIVNESFSFYIGKEEEGKWVHVPKGFLTDGASVPRALWALIPPWGRYGQAAIMHDYLCEYLSIIYKGRPVPISRELADLFFLEAMIVLEVELSTRKMIYSAVAAYTATLSDGFPSSSKEKRAVEAALAKATM